MLKSKWHLDADCVTRRHVWAITTDKISLTAHVVIDIAYDCDDVLPKLRKLLSEQFNIRHTTLQDERKICLDEKSVCHFS